MKIKTCFIDASLKLDQEIEHLLTSLDVTPLRADHSGQVFGYVNQSRDPVSRAKQTLYITKNMGASIRQCPGTSHYTCCDYTILHTATFCSMDCSYCILQAYFHPPVLQYFAGLNQIKSELEQVFRQNRFFRIGTGEFTDSLIWEPVSPMPRFLVQAFARQTHAVLELKTKTVHLNSLLGLDHNQKTILAWSLNTPQIIQSQEKGTTSLGARLRAARESEARGFRLGFHFDPIVIYPGCEKDYQTVVREIFTHVRPDSIVWISLGSFRFMPGLKQIIEKRFPDSTICYGEFIPGLDSKMRYFKPLRISIYKSIISAIREQAPDVLAYFCMEDEEVWEKCLGFYPGNQGGLGSLLNASAAEKCGLRLKK